jgi:hypothetical protein
MEKESAGLDRAKEGRKQGAYVDVVDVSNGKDVVLALELERRSNLESLLGGQELRRGKLAVRVETESYEAVVG